MSVHYTLAVPEDKTRYAYTAFFTIVSEPLLPIVFQPTTTTTTTTTTVPLFFVLTVEMVTTTKESILNPSTCHLDQTCRLNELDCLFTLFYDLFSASRISIQLIITSVQYLSKHI